MPCRGKVCGWWDQNRDLCNSANTLNVYARWEKPETQLPYCPIALSCRWNVQEVSLGRRGCAPRRLDLVCEHQANKPGVDNDRAIWNTFDMADPDDAEAWG